MFTRRQRRVVAIIGVAILLGSLLLILFTFWPLPGAVEVVPLAPTLFAPPQ